MRCLESLKAVDHYNSLSKQHDREQFLSAGGTGVGKIWKDIPRLSNDYYDNDHFRMALLIRLDRVNFEGRIRCQVPRRTRKEEGGYKICGALHTAPLEHPFLCDVGPAQQRAHRAVQRVLTQCFRGLGCYVEEERAIL